MITEIEFSKSFLSHVVDENEGVFPFELIMADIYKGNQQISNEEAKKIADFIYQKLKLKNGNQTN